jgi:hypothetical protein
MSRVRRAPPELQLTSALPRASTRRAGRTAFFAIEMDACTGSALPSKPAASIIRTTVPLRIRAEYPVVGPRNADVPEP